MTYAVDLSNLALEANGAAAGITANTTAISAISVGNSTVNSTINSTAFAIGNSTVNSTINSTAFSISGSFGTNGQVLTSNGTSMLWSTIVGVNTNAAYVFSNTISFGNSTVNTTVNSTLFSIGNTTVNTTISAANTRLYTPTIQGSRETVSANTNAAGAMILDLSYGIFRWTVTGNVTSLNYTNVPANNTVYTGMLYVTANATGTNSTNRAITFPSVANATTGKTLWPGATVPPATSSNSSLDIYSFTTIDGGNNYIWSLSVKDAR